MSDGVFSEGWRVSDFTSAEHGEPISEYLERSTRPQLSTTRTRINDWFRNLCPSMQPGVRSRLTSSSNDEFAAGFWELYLHELLIRLGYQVTCEPALTTGRRIDFFVSRGGASFYLEATVAHSSRGERSADARRNRIYRELQRVRTDQFMFGIEIQRAGPHDMPNAAICRQRVEEWLRGLDPDAVADAWNAGQELPTLEWTAGGWKLNFEAFPVKPSVRGGEIDRPLGMFMDETGGLIDDETPLRRALDRKAPARYGHLDAPFVIAVCEQPFIVGNDDWHRRNALYGRSAIAWAEGVAPHEVRQPDGYWRGPGQRPRNTRVAAVLLGAHVQPWSLDEGALAWWDNPFAARPVAESLVIEVATRHRLVVESGQGELLSSAPRASIAEVLGVAPTTP